MYIESPTGEKFEAEVPPSTTVATLAADFFESQGWPLSNQAGRHQRAIVELVDAKNPNETKRIDGGATIDQAGIIDGDTVRIFPEPVAGGGELFIGLDEIFKDAYKLIDVSTLRHDITTSDVENAVENVFRRIGFRHTLHPIFRGTGFKTEDDLVFVLMPFGSEDLQNVYYDHIRSTLEKFKLRVKRADDIYGTGAIIEDIWEGINKARFIVADLTGRNPNVLYETGICHTVGKHVIMLSQKVDDIPFDLRHLRCIVYEYSPRGGKKLEEQLYTTVLSLLSVK